MSITKKPFGRDLTGREMTLFTMKNASGAEVSVLDFGAHLVSIKVPDKQGNFADVCLGFDTLEEYMAPHASVGATVGRYANRIGDAKFTLNGVEYHLFKNNNGNCLHGGRESFMFKWFQSDILEDEHEDSVLLTYVSHDMEEGFPGKMRLQVTFSLDDENNLTIRYRAQSDKDTVVNLTNHAYFNLAGEGDILNHKVTIHASQITETTDLLIPTGNFKDVEGTPLDLRTGRTIADGLSKRNICHEIDNVNGYDCNYCVPGEGMREMAVLEEEKSGRVMRVFSDQPGIQCYTGQNLGQKGHGDSYYGPFAGIALETQHYADSPNHPNFPTTTLKAGEVFQSVTVYRFE